ncbi:MAG: hypothetical protein IT530_21175 [Burkholderiales bacterium]|nr:hypothetical protein [Burkholderiales bacterium]
MGNQAMEISARLPIAINLLNSIEVQLPDGVPELWQMTTQHLSRTAVHKAIAGLALLKLKEMVGHGRFIPALEERDIPQSTAKEAMAVATFLLRMPEKAREKLAPIAGTKLLELAKLPQESLDELAERELFDGRPLDELSRLSVRELKERVRKDKERAQLKIDGLSKDLDRTRDENAELKLKVADLQLLRAGDDDEAVALRRFAEIEETVSSALIAIVGSNLDKATPQVKLRAAHLCDWIESHARFYAIVLRRNHPECWEGWGPIPTPDEMEEAQGDLHRKAAKLKPQEGEALK